MKSDFFLSIVQKNFHFLINEYDFSISKINDFSVRFENREVFIKITYDARRSYEIDIGLGLLETENHYPEPAYNLGEILRINKAPESRQYRMFQASNPENLELCITKISKLVARYAAVFFSNTDFCFKRLENQRRMECEEYELNTKLRTIREYAQKAWQQKEYSKLIRLYKPVESFLTPVEKQKLHFSVKQNQKSPE